MDHPTTTLSIDDIPLQVSTPDGAVDTLIRALLDSSNAPQTYRFVNTYSIACAYRDQSYAHLLRDGGINYPDGWPLTLIRSGRQDTQLKQVRGPGFFDQALDRGRPFRLRHFFLGGSEDLLEQLQKAANARFPAIEIAGVYSPPFRPLTADERADQTKKIVAARPDIIWVALGAPKQDFEAARITQETGISTAAVGAAFDFFAGTKPEAPSVLRTLHVEWLFRLLSEPARLWRRYLVAGSYFVTLALREARRRLTAG